MERTKKAECKVVALGVREKVGDKTYEIQTGRERRGLCVLSVNERRKRKDGCAASFIDGKQKHPKTTDKNKRPR